MKESDTENEVTKAEIDDEPTNTRCGLVFYPDWLQRLASKKIYIVVYGLLGMNQMAIGSYYTSVVSTIEKRFKLPSTVSGILLSGWDVGHLAATLFIALRGSAGHKTRWLASWAAIAGAGTYLRYLPQLIFDPKEDTVNYNSNGTMGSVNETHSYCGKLNLPQENCDLNSEGLVTFVIILFAQIMMGIGSSAYHTLGAAYLDDNVLKNKFPYLMAMTACIRFIGPVMGYSIGSSTLSKYHIPSVTPDFGPEDSRWIGRWYGGWIPLASTQILLAMVIGFFPRTLPRVAARQLNLNTAKTQLQRTVKATFQRLVTNRVLMFNTFSSTLYFFGLMGFWIFLPKYMETQFRISASEASIITGTVGLVCTTTGLATSGFVVSRFKPRPTYLAAWNVLTESVDVIGTVIFAFVGCQKDDFFGSPSSDGSWNLMHPCNSNCSCSYAIKYSPICSLDGSTTFYSPCHAGCDSSVSLNGIKTFVNCSCVAGSGTAIEGVCPIDCSSQFYLFLGILCFMKFFSATGRAGNTIIQFRSVDPQDKSVSIAFSEMVMCIFSFIPAPIVYGMIIDRACLIWGYNCGKIGNCWLYHSKTLRYTLNFSAAGFLLLGTLCDVGVLCNVRNLKIYDDDDDDDKEKTDENDPVKEKEVLLEPVAPAATSNN